MAALFSQRDEKMSKVGKARLDRSRSHGTVYGAGQARFTQDHKEFDAQGRELIKPGAAPAPQPMTTDTITVVADDLTGVKLKDLRKIYNELTGKKIPVGVSTAKAADMIREARG